MTARTEFTEEERTKLAPMEKIAVVATKNMEGKVHMSLLTSLMPRSADTLTIGEFARGRSKEYMKRNPDIAFAMLSLQGFRGWRGKARWQEERREGEELESYKQMPMHRYNAYFPVYSAHYLKLLELRGPENFGFAAMGVGSLRSAMGAGAVAEKTEDRILKPYGEQICKAPIGLRYLAWIDETGTPAIIPVHNCRAAGSRRLVISGGKHFRELKDIPAGTEVAVFAAKLSLENILIRGQFSGVGNIRGLPGAHIGINWVYNSMPPNADQVYPPVPLEPVSGF